MYVGESEKNVRQVF
jgi:peroxin-6